MRIVALLFALVLVAAACGDDDGGDTADGETTEDTDGEEPEGDDEVDVVQEGGSTYDEVVSRGTLECGVNDVQPGFGFVDEAGEFSGFDIEMCRAVAAGVLGDADAVNFTPLSSDDRFPALQAGDIDVLIRNTTWTATRDGAEGAQFAMTTFYDGQGMMVNSDSGITTIDELDGATVCVLSGTTTELNLATRLPGASAQPLPEVPDISEAFLAGQCEGWTADSSGLAGIRSAWPEADGGPEAVTILDEVFSKEPLGPVTRSGDSEWFDAVNWIVISTIQGEEFGIDSGNVADMQGSDDTAIQRFLGVEDPDEGTVFDAGLALEPGFAAEVIAQVGNYAEIYNRTIGPDTPLGLARGVNALWTDGGLLYPPPYR